MNRAQQEFLQNKVWNIIHDAQCKVEDSDREYKPHTKFKAKIKELEALRPKYEKLWNQVEKVRKEQNKITESIQDILNEDGFYLNGTFTGMAGDDFSRWRDKTNLFELCMKMIRDLKVKDTKEQLSKLYKEYQFEILFPSNRDQVNELLTKLDESIKKIVGGK